VSPDLEYPHGSTESTHPWLGIDLGVYETHMSDPRVGQLQLLGPTTSRPAVPGSGTCWVTGCA